MFFKWILPSRKSDIGLVVSNFSKEILIIAVKGAASKTPIMPQIIPQKIKDRITVIGCKPSASPIILGSKILPIRVWTIVGSKIIKIT